MSGDSFARNHLEKYGWEKGKGLGRTETGISDAIKPKLKFDKAGIGHDVGEQFSFHWWDHVFNQAAKNIHVENTEEGVQVKKGTKSTLISNKRSTHENKKKPTLLYGAFVKHGTLNPDGAISQDKDSTSSSDESDDDNKPPETYEGNDEMLFKACGGRTAHKGARHGLRLSGKLQRIEQQENYHSNQVTKKERKGQSATDEMEREESSCTKKKRKKKRRNEEEIESDGLMDSVKNRLEEMEGVEDDVEKIQCKKKKRKKHKGTDLESLEDTPVNAINEDGTSSSISSSGVGLKENDGLCSAHLMTKKPKKGKKSKLRMNVEIVEGETHNDHVSNEGADADSRRRKKKAKKEKRKVEMDRDIENSDSSQNRKGHYSSGRKDRSEGENNEEVKTKKKDVKKSGKRRKQVEDEEAFNASSVNQGHDKHICNGVSKKKKKRKSDNALLGS